MVRMFSEKLSKGDQASSIALSYDCMVKLLLVFYMCDKFIM